MSPKSRPLYTFYALVIYVLLQFTWWAYLLVELNNEVYRQKEEVILFRSSNPQEAFEMAKETESRLHKRWLMIAGEASVFFAILMYGIYRVRKSMRREEELAKQQKNFLLSVTHELKSPIASAKLQMETLLMRELEKEKQKEVITGAIQDTERLNNLVENILLAAKIENTGIQLNKENISLTTLLEETCVGFIRRFRIKHRIVVEAEKDIRLHADSFSLVTIISNLVENAVKYSPETSSIHIRLKNKSGQIIFSISDEGPGIPDAEKQNIFEKFYRIGNEETRSTKGTGLGLFIVKYLVEQNNGTISVRDNSPIGTVFEIVFSI